MNYLYVSEIHYYNKIILGVFYDNSERKKINSGPEH